jgi:hypothetical protein
MFQNGIWDLCGMDMPCLVCFGLCPKCSRCESITFKSVEDVIVM